MKLVSFIIVTYNSQSDILNCLESVFATADIGVDELEIIIVDNSTRLVFSETEALVRKRFGIGILMVHNPVNGGYGQGNNIGVGLASANLICIANPDIILTSSIFRNALQLFLQDPLLGIVGGNQSGGPNFSFWLRPEFEFFVLTAPLQKLLNWMHCYMEQYFFLSGALLFIDKAKFIEIGSFDESMFLYGEEADITKRFLSAGYRTAYRRDFTYLHLLDNRSEDIGNSLNTMLDSYRFYFSKHQLSFANYLRCRILSCRILILVGIIFRRPKLYERNLLYLNIFKKKLNTL